MKKQIFKLSLLLGAFLLLNLSGHAQDIKKMENDSNLFEGKWVARFQDNSYELTIKKDTLYTGNPLNMYFETLLGSIIYKKNESIVRITQIDGTSSFISVHLLSPLEANVRLNDKGRKIAGEGRMVINPNNPKRATWKIWKGEMNMIREGWGKVDFDIPRELEWTKIE